MRLTTTDAKVNFNIKFFTQIKMALRHLSAFHNFIPCRSPWKNCWTIIQMMLHDTHVASQKCDLREWFNISRKRSSVHFYHLFKSTFMMLGLCFIWFQAVPSKVCLKEARLMGYSVLHHELIGSNPVRRCHIWICLHRITWVHLRPSLPYNAPKLLLRGIDTEIRSIDSISELHRS